MTHDLTSVLCLVLLTASTRCTPENEVNGGNAPSVPVLDASNAPSAPVRDGGGAPSTPMVDRSVPAVGWRWESSLGVEVAVPEDWRISDTDCRQTDAPSVVRSQGVVDNCFTPEPPTKQIVVIADERTTRDVERPTDLAFRDVILGTRTAERGEGVTADGRAAGWLHVPSIGVIVDVRVKDQETLQTVLDSVRLVDADHNLCATSRENMKPVAPKTNTLAPSNASAVSCATSTERTSFKPRR